MNIDFNLSQFVLSDLCTRDYEKKVRDIHLKLHAEDKSAGTAWVDWPEAYDKAELAKILKLAKRIREDSDALLVIGIGGSYLGARAGLEFMGNKSGVEIVFAGISLDYSDLAEKLEALKNKNVTVNVVSKSGTTIEILTTLSLVEKFMKNKYKSAYKSRMIFTTDKKKGYLRERANFEGIETLTVPDNIGGRYSVLTAVGLLPFAVAGLNIKAILQGASKAHTELSDENIENNPAYMYAVYRNLLVKKLNKKLEIFSSFSSKLSSFGAWLQQLYCESEGKEGKGLFVTSLTFSTDLHSVGQFIQQGSPIMAETFIDVRSNGKDATIPSVPLSSPIKFLDGKKMSEICEAGFDGTLKAHADAKVPISIITIDNLSEESFGELVYFFELSCAASGYLLEVNPFDQPGVEQYKAYMKGNLKK